MLQRLFEEAFEDLLLAWRHDHDLHLEGASLTKLLESRDRLDERRRRADRLRRAFAPEETELTEVALATFCGVLGETVFLHHRDVESEDGAAFYRCLCGEAVTAALATH